MASINLNQNILSLEGNANYGDIAAASAAAAIDFKGNVQFERGMDIELGVGIMAKLDAGFSKFLTAGATVDASASAGLKGQIQAPLNLFDEAGMAVRLRAYAKASIRAKLFVGLAMGDFIALALQDDRINGVYQRLLLIFLEELEIVGGVEAQAAFTAMAFANLAVVGSLLPNSAENLDAGFTITGSMGAGLEGGASVGFFANIGAKDPRRWIRRSIDVTVDDAVARALNKFDDAEQVGQILTRSLRAPAKIAFRSAFEIGRTLAENASAIGDAGPKLMQSSVAIILEELQRVLLEMMGSYAIELISETILSLGEIGDAWEEAAPQRHFLARKLRTLPAEPFQMEHALYWTQLFDGVVNLGVQMGSSLVEQTWVGPLAQLWCAVQLALTSWERISDVSARASLFGMMDASTKLRAFEGKVTTAVPAPTIVQHHINTALNRTADTPLLQEDLVAFLIDLGFDTLLDQFPELKPILEIVAGHDANPAALAAAGSAILTNIGAFVPNEAGEIDLEATMRVLVSGLETYILIRLEDTENGLLPILYTLTDDDPTFRIYIDEVVMTTLKFSISKLFHEVLNWGFGQTMMDQALKEACSSVLMKLFGRSLVVTADVLLDHILRYSQTELLKLASEVDEEGGVADLLAAEVNADRELITEIMEDTLVVASEVFAPIPMQSRTILREAMYGIFDVVPNNPESNWVENLAQDFFLPEPQTVANLTIIAEQLGIHLLDVMADFSTQILKRIADRTGDEIFEMLAYWFDQIEAWLIDLQQEISQLVTQIANIVSEIAIYTNRLVSEFITALTQLEHDLKAIFDNASSEITAHLVQIATPNAQAALFTDQTYKHLPKSVRDMFVLPLFNSHLENVLQSQIDSLFVNPIDQLANEIQTHLEMILSSVEKNDLSPAQLEAWIQQQFSQLIIDGISDGLQKPFNLHVGFTFEYPEPSYDIMTIAEKLMPTKSASIGINFKLEIDDILIGLREVLESLPAFDTLTQNLKSYLDERLMQLETLHTLHVERAAKEVMKSAKEKVLATSYTSNMEVDIIAPAHGAILSSIPTCRLQLQNIPISFLGRAPESRQRLIIFVNQTILDLNEADYVDMAAQTDVRDSHMRENAPTAVYLIEPSQQRRIDRQKSKNKRGERPFTGPNSQKQPYQERNIKSALITPAFVRTKPRTTRPIHRIGKGRNIPRTSFRDYQIPDPRLKNQRELAPIKSVEVYHSGVTNGFANVPDTNQYNYEQKANLTVIIPSNLLENGLNTLTVIVTNGSGQNITKSISFVYKKYDAKEGESPKSVIDIDDLGYPDYVSDALKERGLIQHKQLDDSPGNHLPRTTKKVNEMPRNLPRATIKTRKARLKQSLSKLFTE